MKHQSGNSIELPVPIKGPISIWFYLAITLLLVTIVAIYGGRYVQSRNAPSWDAASWVAVAVTAAACLIMLGAFAIDQYYFARRLLH